MMRNRFHQGFTLLEILLVVLIVSIMTVVGTNLVNSQSVEREILNQAQKFSDDLTYVCEKAVLENQAYGIEFYANAYQVLRYQQPEWLLVESQKAALINAAIEVNLLLDGLSQDLEQVDTLQAQALPHIICQSDGSFNAFELRFIAVDKRQLSAAEKPTYYSISTPSPWQLEGVWHQP